MRFVIGFCWTMTIWLIFSLRVGWWGLRVNGWVFSWWCGIVWVGGTCLRVGGWIEGFVIGECVWWVSFIGGVAGFWCWVSQLLIRIFVARYSWVDSFWWGLRSFFCWTRGFLRVRKGSSWVILTEITCLPIRSWSFRVRSKFIVFNLSQTEITFSVYAVTFRPPRFCNSV